MTAHPTTELNWQKSSYCWNPKELVCLELAMLPNGDLAVRDSKNPAGPMLSVPRRAGRAFIAAAPDLTP